MITTIYQCVTLVGEFGKAFINYGVPRGIRTPVAAVKGRCPRPLDDGDNSEKVYSIEEILRH